MAKLTDIQIRAWVRAGERFEGRSDGNGLYLRYRETDRAPVWRFRYKIAGKAKVIQIGSYAEMSLAKARERTRELSALVSLGYDVAAEKQERKAAVKAKSEAAKPTLLVSAVAADYFMQQVQGRVKRPQFVKQYIDKDINPHIGALGIAEVTPVHVDKMLRAVNARGAKTAAHKVLGITKRIFNYAIKRQFVNANPAAAFTTDDAGGPAKARERWLTRDELVSLFKAMRTAKGFSRANELAMKLLLALGCRKMELCAAQWVEFDLDNSVWHSPGSKKGDSIDILLPPVTVTWLQELKALSYGSEWVLPARASTLQNAPHIAESTLLVALAKLRSQLPGVPHFTIHDFRRTARTHLAALGVDPVVAERCLNHKIPGVEGIYNRHQYFAERRAGLELWADLLVALEQGENYNVVSIAKRK